MGGALLIEELDRSNYTSWEYKMHQYLLGQGYWSYIHRKKETTQNPAHKDFVKSYLRKLVDTTDSAG